MLSIITADKKNYKLECDLMRKYSGFYRNIIQQNENNQQGQQIKKQELIITINEFNSQEFDYIYEYFQLHKNKLSKQISIRNKKDIEQGDYELMQRIRQLSNDKINNIIKAIYYFDIPSMRDRLVAIVISQMLQEFKKKPLNKIQKSVSEQIDEKIHNLQKYIKYYQQ